MQKQNSNLGYRKLFRQKETIQTWINAGLGATAINKLINLDMTVDLSTTSRFIRELKESQQ